MSQKIDPDLTLMMIHRSNDMADLTGQSYAILDHVIRTVAKISGRPLESLSVIQLMVSNEGILPIRCARIEYPGYLGSGSRHKDEFYAVSARDAGMLTLALYRRQNGEADIKIIECL